MNLRRGHRAFPIIHLFSSIKSSRISTITLLFLDNSTAFDGGRVVVMLTDLVKAGIDLSLLLIC